MAILSLAGLASLAIQVVPYVVWLIGIVLALVRWRQHPRASLLMVIGLVLVAIGQTMVIAMNVLSPNLLSSRGTPVRSINTFLTVANGVFSLLKAVVSGLLLAAVFVERPPADAEAAE